MKKVLIIGGGYAGCCAARVLKDSGHDAVIFEKDDSLGGLAKSYKMDGMTYEFGPHILANHNCEPHIIDFVRKFLEVGETSMETASFVQGRYLNYPPNIDDVKHLKEREKIEEELSRLSPDRVDETNFETYLISRVGETLYEIYFKEFTEKFWQVEPRTLSAEWAKTRHLGESLTEKKMFFNKMWCSYPKRDFNELFENISRGIEVKYNTEITDADFEAGVLIDQDNNRFEGDFIISTLSIDSLLGLKHGRLDYAGYTVEPVIIDKEYYHPANPDTGKHYSMVYYPSKEFKHTRITEYKCFNNKHNDEPYRGRTIITIETPSKDARFYPFYDEKNLQRLKSYLEELSKHKNIVSLGRLGLYKYTTIDTTTQQVFRFIEYFDRWESMSSQERFDAYMKIRGEWDN